MAESNSHRSKTPPSETGTPVGPPLAPTRRDFLEVAGAAGLGLFAYSGASQLLPPGVADAATPTGASNLVVATGTLQDAYNIQQAIEKAGDGTVIWLKNADSGPGADGFLMPDFSSIVRRDSVYYVSRYNFIRGTGPGQHSDDEMAPGTGSNWLQFWSTAAPDASATPFVRNWEDLGVNEQFYCAVLYFGAANVYGLKDLTVEGVLDSLGGRPKITGGGEVDTSAWCVRMLKPMTVLVHGIRYVCIQRHVSTSSDEPGSGYNWRSSWRKVDGADGARGYGTLLPDPSEAEPWELNTWYPRYERTPRKSMRFRNLHFRNSAYAGVFLAGVVDGEISNCVIEYTNPRLRARPEGGISLDGILVANNGEQPQAARGDVGSAQTTSRYYASPAVIGQLVIDSNLIDLQTDPAPADGWPLYKYRATVASPDGRIYRYASVRWHVAQYDPATTLGNKPGWGTDWPFYWKRESELPPGPIPDPVNWVEGYSYFTDGMLAAVDGPYALASSGIVTYLIGDTRYPTARLVVRNNRLRHVSRIGLSVADIDGSADVTDNVVEHTDWVPVFASSGGFQSLLGTGTSDPDVFSGILSVPNLAITSESVKVRRNGNGIDYGLQIMAVPGSDLVDGETFTIDQYHVAGGVPTLVRSDVYEFDANHTVTAGRTHVSFAPGMSASEIAVAIRTAIAATPGIGLVPGGSGAGVIVYPTDYAHHLVITDTVGDPGFTVAGEEVAYDNRFGALVGFGAGTGKITGSVDYGTGQITVRESDDVIGAGDECCVDYVKHVYQRGSPFSATGFLYTEGAIGTTRKVGLNSAAVSVARNIIRSAQLDFVGLVITSTTGAKQQLSILQNQVFLMGGPANPALSFLWLRGVDHATVGQNKCEGLARLGVALGYASAFRGSNGNAFLGNNLSAASCLTTSLLIGPDANGNVFNGSGHTWEDYIIDPAFVANPPNVIAGVTRQAGGLGETLRTALRQQAALEEGGTPYAVNDDAGVP